MEEPKISIIIVNYNGWADTIECLESILRGGYGNYRLVVVDNGSSDGSMDKLEAWAAGRLDVRPDPANPLRERSCCPVSKPIPYVRCSMQEAEGPGGISRQEPGKAGTRGDVITMPGTIVFLETGRNLGFAGGNNIGIKYAMRSNSSYVLLLNNDTAVEPDFLAELAGTAERSDRIGVVGGCIAYYHDPSRLWYAGGRVDLLRGSGYHLRSGRAEGQYKVGFVTGCLMLISRRVIDSVGLLAEEYFLTAEDVDYCWSCQRAGFELWVNMKSKVYHKVSASMSRVGTSVEVYYNTRNRLHFMLRRVRRLRYVLPFCAFFSASRLIKAVGFIVRGRIGQATALWRGLRDGLSGRLGPSRWATIGDDGPIARLR